MDSTKRSRLLKAIERAMAERGRLAEHPGNVVWSSGEGDERVTLTLGELRELLQEPRP